MTEKRRIDLIRDSAGSIEVTTEDDKSSITGFLKIGDTLHVVKERGIYTIVMADQIDPERTNEKIPSTYQRVIPIGSDDPIIIHTLLTANELFKKQYLGNHFDESKALSLSLNLAKDILAMRELQESLAGEEDMISKTYSSSEVKGALSLPSLADVEHRLDAFAQKVGHAMKAWKKIAELFYGDQLGKKWFDGLVRCVGKKHANEHPFKEFLRVIQPTILFLIEMRNMIEHPKDSDHIEVRDFHLLSSGEIMRPTITINQSGQESETASLSAFMEDIVTNLPFMTETLFAHIANVHVQPFAGFHIGVHVIPENAKGNSQIRVGYGVLDKNGEFIRFG